MENNQNTDWTAVLKFPLIGKTKFSPAIIGSNNRLICVWAAEDGYLNYSTTIVEPGALHQNSPTYWAERPWNKPIVFRDLKPLNTPSLAIYNGHVHMVVIDTSNKAIHCQYDLNNPGANWERVLHFGWDIESTTLATYDGYLYCVYKKTNEATLTSKKYNERFFWAIDGQTVDGVNGVQGQFVLFELHGKLQLFISSGAQAGQVQGFSYGNEQWTPVPAFSSGPSMQASASGLHGATLNSRAFLVCSYNSAIVLKNFNGQSWEQHIIIENDTPALLAPSITVVDNKAICMWVDPKSYTVQVIIRNWWPLPPFTSWMSAIKDDVLISNLTIPGSHDSCCATTKFPFAQTQTELIPSQLARGVRYFDLRGGYWKYAFSSFYSLPKGHNPDAIYIFHNVVPIFQGEQTVLTLSTVLQQIYTFIEATGESVIVQIKLDCGKDDPEARAKFAKDVLALIQPNAKYWRLDASVPTMGVLRKKIQLIRRFQLPVGMQEFGIDVSGDAWVDNEFSDIRPAGPNRVRIQDCWSLSSITDFKVGVEFKLSKIQEHLQDASQDPSVNVLYLNFCSANGVPHTSPWDYVKGATLTVFTDFTLSGVDSDVIKVVGINKTVATYFNDTARQGVRYGIILLDWPEEPEELVAGLIKTNIGKFK